MAQSPEHQFLSETFLTVLAHFSRSNMYAYRESDRGVFDFSCILAENWSRLLDGQTLWKHPEGIDKDIRTLLASSQANIVVYVARDTTKHRGGVFEAVRDYRQSSMRDSLVKLKVFWIPSDFDADSEVARQLVADQLKREVVEDILFNVVFGKISAARIRPIVLGSGLVGLPYALLHHVATEGFFNFSMLKKRLDASPATLRDRMQRLIMSGLVLQPRTMGQDYAASPARRAFLRICSSVHRLRDPSATLGGEVTEILRLLDIEPVDDIAQNFRYEKDWVGGQTEEAMFAMLFGGTCMAEFNLGS